MRAYIVLNKGENTTFLPYAEKYKVYLDAKEALDRICKEFRKSKDRCSSYGIGWRY